MQSDEIIDGIRYRDNVLTQMREWWDEVDNCWKPVKGEKPIVASPPTPAPSSAASNSVLEREMMEDGERRWLNDYWKPID